MIRAADGQERGPGGAHSYRQRVIPISFDDRRTCSTGLSYGRYRLFYDGGLGRIEGRRPEQCDAPSGIRLNLNIGYYGGPRHRAFVVIDRYPLFGPEQPKAGELHLAGEQYVGRRERAECSTVQETEPVLLQFARCAG